MKSMLQPILRYMPHEFRWDVVGTRFYWYIFTMALIVISLVSIATKGFNFGIDFAGGVMIEARAEQALDLGKLRSRPQQPWASARCRSPLSATPAATS